MGKVISGQGVENAYNYRNFNILCEQCEVSGEEKADITDYFIDGRIPANNVLLKHFAALKVFYTNIFLTKDIYNGKTDAVRIVLHNCYNKGLRTIIDPGCHIRSRAEKFMREYRNNKAVLIETKTTGKLDMAHMVRVEDYGLKFMCPGRGVYLIQQAKATEFIYSEKGSYNEFLNSIPEEPEKPSLIKAVTTGFKKRRDTEPEEVSQVTENMEKPAEETKDEGRILQFPIEALKNLIDILARQGMASSARMVKILVNNYNVILNELQRARDKRDWLDGHYYVYSLLDNSASAAYKQLEKAANACEDVVRRYEALKSLSACKPAFINIWNACLRALEQQEIRIIPIKWRDTAFIVSENELKEGWELHNSENRKADAENPVNKIYGVLQNGVVVENEVVRRPVVNVYTE